MASFEEFDPLKAKQALNTEVAINAMKRELTNILDSYVGWYDPFCELIQNALDSVEEKASSAGADYVPQVHIAIDMPDNSVSVTDNGIGLTKDQYEQFLAPSFSFKSGKRRGHKGVGATYLAYGFNFIQISTKAPDFEATGKMLNARKWLSDENPAGNPKVQPDPQGPMDKSFAEFESGVSVYLRFDPSTHPANLSWIKAETPEQWLVILSLKTGLGAFFANDRIHVRIRVRDSLGVDATKDCQGISYYWPHKVVTKAQSLRDLKKKEEELFAKHGKNFKMPAAMTNLDAIYDTISADELGSLIALDESETDILKRHLPIVYFSYMYSAKVWASFNEGLQVRQNANILSPGIQIAANNMPQGEIIQIPLRRYSGRQEQAQFYIHFENCKADLGRKGFQKEIQEFCKSTSRKLVDKPIQKFLYVLRPVTGVKDDLLRESEVDDWKEEMTKHEKENPLVFANDNFFIPMKRISITSSPTREQDVIALFNQLVAGGVVRGIRIMSTNERFTYDGMYRVVFDQPSSLHIYDKVTNPLGVLPEYVQIHPTFESKPKILEYKWSLDGLIEDLETGNKNPKDIALVVVWEMGEDYQGNYLISSLLDEDNLAIRQYHGVTHVMTNVNTGQREMDLIVLKELIGHLNDPVSSLEYQKKKYGE